MPTPRPEMSVTFSRRRKPGSKMSPMACWSSHGLGFLGGHHALFDADLAHLHRVDAAPVVLDLDGHGVALVVGAQPDRPVSGLPLASRSSLGSRPWSTEFADHVHQRIADFLY
jgi:hypothetical protein